MKRKTTLPDGTIIEIEGDMEELLEYDRRYNDNKPLKEKKKGRGILKG